MVEVYIGGQLWDRFGACPKLREIPMLSAIRMYDPFQRL